jgi:hypothetical protein
MGASLFLKIVQSYRFSDWTVAPNQPPLLMAQERGEMVHSGKNTLLTATEVSNFDLTARAHQ